ncbi:NAD(P)/FAD-dependent oxidoreductase [Bacillus tianshenii]|nr:NAD(P)/FAD-dependent oxidoreductase [Bacillus tianshenii]
MAAIAASEHGAKTLLIDKGSKLGRKLAISGGGRCNVTNRMPIEEIIQHIPGNGRFLYSAFSEFDNEDIIRFFEKLGVGLKEEDNGRMFPTSNRAQSVVEALLSRLDRLKVDIRTNTPVKTIRYDDEKAKGITLKNGEEIDSKAIVIAVGGKSVPHTGSTGDGYAWAEKAGHTITDLFPTEVPLTSKEPFIRNRELQGISIRNGALSVINKKGKKIVTHEMDFLFTHLGLSGPAALRCSQYIVKEMKKQSGNPVTITVDLFPKQNEEQAFQMLTKQLKQHSKKSIKNVLKEMIQERYLLFLLERNEIDPQTTYDHLSNEQLRSLITDIKNLHVKINGTLPIEKAFVTGGGVSIKEVHPKTMASKKKVGLFFCGEILDIHGYTGGFNITAALVTGRLAGYNAATGGA